MKKCFLLLFFALSAFVVGCNEYNDKRVDLATGVKSDTLVNNVLTRPVYASFSLLAGEGIDLKDVKVFTNDSGFMEVQAEGYNRAVYTKRFDYKVEWLNEDGVTVPSKASTWQNVSAGAMTPFRFKAVAPTKDAVDFRMTTRKTPE